VGRIDQYLQSLTKLGADALVMKPDQRILLRFESGEREASQSTARGVIHLIRLGGPTATARRP